MHILPTPNRAVLTCLVALSLCAGLSACKKKSENAAASSGDAPITGSASDAPVAVAPTWKPGNRYVMRLERNQSSQLPAGPMRPPGATNVPPMETTYAQEYAVTVTNAPDGARGAELEILAIELQVGRGDEQFINYDSQNKVAPRDPNNPLPAALDRLIGGKIRYAFDSSNKVTKVEGVSQLMDRVNPQGGGGGGGFGGGMMRGMLRGALTEDTFKQMVDLSGAPPNAVKIGESWPLNRDISAPMIGKLALSITNTLRGWQEHDKVRCARVDFTGTIGSGGAGPGPMGGSVSVSNGRVKGFHWYDPEIGLSREMQSEQTYTITVTGLGNGRRGPNAAGQTNAAPQPIVAPVRENTSVKLLEIKPAAQG